MPGPISRSIRGRLEARERWKRGWNRPAERGPVVWMHGASVGELLAARPILEKLQKRLHNLSWVCSHTSPSPQLWPDSMGCVHRDFLPLASESEMREVYRAVDPQLVLVSRGDVWPEIVTAQSAGIPVALVGARVGPDSLRVRFPRVQRKLYRRLDLISAVSEADARRYLHLGARPEVVQVDGDPAHDRLLEREPDLSLVPLWSGAGSERPLLMAGSTHPEDDDLLLDAFARVRASQPSARLAIVPHEPDRETVSRLVSRADEHGMTCRLFSSAELTGLSDLVIVDEIGRLADHYFGADIAYVGGGFGHGLHSVAEPAVCAIPVIFGAALPLDPDARQLLELGGGESLGEPDPAELAGIWLRYLGDPGTRVRTGMKAKQLVEPGAAGRAAETVLKLMVEDRE